MASRFQEQSHFEYTSPPASIHGARGDEGVETSNAPGRTSDEASSIDHVQEKAPVVVPLTKKQKFKRHCGRFKWWYLVAAIILAAILLPLLFTEIIPAITQNIVNDQKFPVLGGTFQAISPTQLNISLQTQLNTPLAADLDPTVLYLYNKDTPEYSPFLNITLPKLHVNHKTPVGVMEQTATVTNETELVRWFSDVFDEPSVKISVKGSAHVHLGALHSTAHIDKTIEAGALNHLAGFGITDLKLVFPALENGTNMRGSLSLPNSGVLTLGLGNISFNLFSGDVRLGLIHIYDAILPPGNNTRSFDGELYLNELVPNLGVILDSQASALADGNLQLNVTGNATIVNGMHIGYVEQVLNNKMLTLTLPVIKLLGDVIGSFSGNSNASLTDLLGDTIGNSTFIEGLLNHWNSTTTAANSTGSAVKMGRSTPYGSRTIKAPATKSLLKMGLKLALAKL
ncbi:hypothetical protein F5Y19DRAFT_271841 [Xylariaceae sp. FL1651]|nr:hypothetical protein F5Y19DRAFT_271841 [Xylariaceae sp. FL1651]